MKAVFAFVVTACWLSPGVVLAAAGGAVHGGIDPDLAIVTAIVFLILVTVLWKFAWGPIMEALAHREKSIADDLGAAQKSNEESQRLLAEHEAKLAGATDEVRQLIEEARRSAETQSQEIVADAQKAAEAQKARAVQEISVAKDSALEELAQKSVDTAVGLAGQIVKRQLNSGDHAELIGDALKQFPSNN